MSGFSHMGVRRAALSAAASLGLFAFAGATRAAVVINEFQYDDGGTDNLEFVELYNNGLTSVDISGWTVGGQDQGVARNTESVVPASTSLASGAYYVIGNAAVTNVNLVVPGDRFENSAETLELRTGTFVSGGVLQDAVVYESNKRATQGASDGHGTLPAPLVAETNGGYFANSQSNDGTGAPLAAVGRYYNGVDTNVNGRDFGMRKATPGATNNFAGTMTAYAPPNVDADADGAVVAGLTGSFVGARVISPGTVRAINPNAIPDSPSGGKAIVAWDSSGGGNGIASDASFDGPASFNLFAYLDTADLPVSTNTSSVNFRSSEVTTYGLLGSADPLQNLTDISGQLGIVTALPSADTANGNTGIAWHYEKVGVPVGGGAVSEKLYLVDAGKGGDSGTGGNTPIEWDILATIDLSGAASGWFQLGITVDAAGNGSATFIDPNGILASQVIPFTTDPSLDGAFYTAYRENAQATGASPGSIAVPSYVRPATFDMIPEPAGLALLGVGGLFLRRRRA